MHIQGLLVLKYAYGRYKKAKAELMKNRPSRCGVVLPIIKTGFKATARYPYLARLSMTTSSICRRLLQPQISATSKIGSFQG